jgi:tetratricopeptide (TPR) repeat protein
MTLQKNWDSEIRLQEAVVHHQDGRLGEAQVLYREILDIDPEDSNALHLLGVTYYQQGFPETAIPLIGASIRINPTNCLAYTNLGNALQGIGKSLEAIHCYDCALSIAPLHADAFFNRGIALQSLDRPEEALSSYEQAIVADDQHVEAHFRRGNSLYALGRPDEAIVSYDRVIVHSPSHAEAYFNRGVVLQSVERNEEALRSYNHTLQINPDHARAFNNRGNTLQSLDLYQDAINSYGRAQAICPDYGDPYWNEALCRLKTGDFEIGWEKYEWRWANSISNPTRRAFAQPRWFGDEDLHGKTILIHAEQGFGDTIQFCRYAKLVVQRGAHVILEVQTELKALLNHIEGVEVVSSLERPGQYDFHCPLMSLPLAFGTRLATIPSSHAYVECDPVLGSTWKAKLGNKLAPRIGLAWSGNRDNTNDPARSCGLSEMSRLFRHDIEWFCLQKDFTSADQILINSMALPRFSEELTTFAETAALIEQMDLVISVDTAVAHLAAAMGKPTWLLLAHNADFRWLLGRRDSPWYPTMLLFRQTRMGDWSGLITKMSDFMLSNYDQQLGVRS